MSRSKTLPAIFQGLDAGLKMFRWVVLVLLAFFFASGITMVQPKNIALVLRFGKLEGKTPATQIKQPGLLLALPYPVDRVVQVPIREEGEVTTEEVWKSLDTKEKVKKLLINPIKEGYCLTGDQNIIQAKITVKYKISDPVAFQLWVDKPDAMVTDTVLASLTQTVSSWKVNDVIRLQRLNGKPKEAASDKSGESKEALEKEADATAATTTGSPKTSTTPSQPKKDSTESLARLVWSGAQKRLDQLNIGVTITALEFKEIHPPRHVISWFREVQSEKIGMTTKKREAEGTAHQEIKFGEQTRNAFEQEARAYKSALTARAQAELSVFERVHAEYVKNPELVLRRLYLETLEVVLINVGKLDFLDQGTRVIFSGSEKQQ